MDKELMKQIEWLRSMPPDMQRVNLIIACKIFPSSNNTIERQARILAEHKMPIEEIFPCIMDLMEDTFKWAEEREVDN